MKRIFLIAISAIAMFSAMQNAQARQVKLSTKVGPAQLQAACDAAGGSFWSNADGYSCVKLNCDGKGHACAVNCNMEGSCTGTVPVKTPPKSKDLRGILNPYITNMQ